jgi:hypothetical protein
MSAAIIERLRKNREVKVSAGGHIFVVRRPTDLDMIELRGELSARALLRYLVGWEQVTELDIIAGGAAHPVAFDAGLASEWLPDRPDLISAVVQGVIGAYSEHSAQREAAAKN